MTIPGIDMVVAVGLMAAIGKIERFDKPEKLAPISASIRASTSLVTAPLITAGSPSAAGRTLVICWLKQLGRRRALRDRFAPPMKECGRDAAITLPPSPWLASSP
jgi:hypothetical protein